MHENLSKNRFTVVKKEMKQMSFKGKIDAKVITSYN